MTKKLHIITHGCQMNVADSNLMAAHLQDRGMTLTGSREAADLIILNTCSVRFDAEHKALSLIGALRPLKRAKPGLKIAVAGCAAQRLGKKLNKLFPFVDLVTGAKEIDRIAAVLDREFPPGCRPAPQIKRARLPARAKESGAAAFVTVMRGCENFCSYCIVPHLRGPEASRPAGEVIAEIEANAAAGYKEAVLLGQNVNSYNSGGLDFPGLLARANSVKGLERIRFMTSHPKDLGPGLIRAMAELEKVCGHLHLPLQSGSDAILAAMNRKYTAADYCALAGKLRDSVPGISLTTDILVGFPGETEADFQKTLDLVNRLEFNSLFAFKYSPREGTAAFSLPETATEGEKEERLRRVEEAADRLSRRKNAGLVGTVQHLLVEKTEKGRCTGRTRSNLKVF
ncbi:MAG: tRNA (N6-isopentenyl adenosine(37)-C2)-methylthiotransferase MiaB, partial [Elusimicrobia bacterium RIFOXYB2_FULL_62_6]